MVEDTDAVLLERLGALGLEQKVRLLTGADFWALYDEPAAGLRRLVTSDGPAGVRGERWDERDPAANVPSPTALAATWDEARIERLGGLLAAECRRKGVDVLLAPTVNLHRSPYGGRHFECFSEDPLLTARIGIAYVNGLQRAGVGATVKHFVANDSETERFTLDAPAAALDLVMPGPSGPWGDALVAAVRDGRVSEAVVDDKVLRILRLASRVGALGDVAAAPPTFDVPAELRATAAASFVLARN